jgi:histidinol phosphatase-like PHP family hydrolase
MIDLHSHTLHSDGTLLPAELARRAEMSGYRGLALTDHADGSNLKEVLDCALRVVREYGPYLGVELVAGVELTHVPPGLIGQEIERSRKLGARIVVVHGETVSEPVALGTNLAAIEAGADLLAHPGLISDVEAGLAARNGVALEVSTRPGHCLANGHVVVMARKHGACMVLNSDIHGPDDLLTRDMRRVAARGAGMTEQEFMQAEAAARKILSGAF